MSEKAANVNRKTLPFRKPSKDHFKNCNKVWLLETKRQINDGWIN